MLKKMTDIDPLTDLTSPLKPVEKDKLTQAFENLSLKPSVNSSAPQPFNQSKKRNHSSISQSDTMEEDASHTPKKINQPKINSFFKPAGIFPDEVINSISILSLKDSKK